MSEIRMLPPVTRFNAIVGNLFSNLRRLPSCEHSDTAMQKSLTWVIETAYTQAKAALEAKHKPVFPINPRDDEHYKQYRQYMDNMTYLRDRYNHFRELAGIDLSKVCRDGRYAPGGTLHRPSQGANFSTNTV